MRRPKKVTTGGWDVTCAKPAPLLQRELSGDGTGSPHVGESLAPGQNRQIAQIDNLGSPAPTAPALAPVFDLSRFRRLAALTETPAQRREAFAGYRLLEESRIIDRESKRLEKAAKSLARQAMEAYRGR